MKRSWSSALDIGIFAAVSAIGVIAFLYPFWRPAAQPAAQMGLAHADDAPLVTTLLIAACLAAMVIEAQGQAMSVKRIALLGVLVAINSALRFVETALPGPGGFTPIFFLILLAGYVFGARFGTLMGALTLLVSALFTGGVGPWLPYQMFTAGWMGMSAGWLGALRLERRPPVEMAALAIFGTAWGFLYGATMNVWFWPFAAGPADQYWTAGTGIAETLRRYAVFYAATSFAWDLFRAAGNAMLMALFGAPALRALRRFERRFAFRYRPAECLDEAIHAGR